ncbi:putative RDD family membrane protein YckC [Nocardioides sp. HB32]
MRTPAGASVSAVTQIGPGWYADPWQQAGQQPVVRWWDGGQWTGHVQPVTGAPVPAAHAGPPTTPDGVELAAWGRRVAAYLVDVVILVPVMVVASIPFWGDLAGPIRDFWDETSRALDAGTEPPSSWDLQRELASTMIVIGLISCAINFAYHVGFLMWKQATPGKLVLGMRVRRRDVPGPMPLGTVVLRWLTQFGPSLLSGITYVGWLVSTYSFLDGLWPLWDARRQALHDKAARTNVVVTR